MGVRRQNFSKSLNIDPRELPAYTLLEASHYLQVPTATLGSWVSGRYYPTEHGKKFFRPVLHLPNPSKRWLSFVNLVEAHVLHAIRSQHHVPLENVRKAVQYVQKEFSSRHPLADQEFETNGCDLFLQKYGQLINLSRDGQLAMRSVLEKYLRRIERDEMGLAARLYPFTRGINAESFKAVVIDPKLSFGRPVLAGTGVPTVVVADRYKAGDSIDDLAADYGLDRLNIEEAIRCELEVKAA